VNRTFELASGTYHAIERGDGARRVVFLHGFPDHPPAALPFLEALATRGFHVLAPWLPGYAPSPTTGPMTRDRIARDLLSLINSWSPDAPVDLVGHDWGAVMTYALCAMEPERIRRAVAMAVPHPRTFMRQFRTAAQLRASWYMLLFQLPGAGHLVAARDFALVDRLWRDWSPGFRLPDDDRRALHACLAESMPAPINWYRATARDTKGVRLFAKPLTTPLLYLHGADDGCILPSTVDDSRHFAGDYKREVIDGVGHFLHLEDPAGLSARVADWLA
jgi:pimeloyl-ACP methyl ester carboxylesterase